MKRILVAGVFLFFCLSFCACGETSYFEDMSELEEVELSGEDSEETGEVALEESTTLWYVQVSGAVKTPGVYELPENSRVYQAIEAAGGLLSTADDSTLNQAAFLTDGQKIHIKTKGEAEEEAEEDDGRVDLNKASLSDLMTLPGIGQSKAEAIISYREEHGAFTSCEELMNISGIKEGVYNKISSSIKVN